MFSSAFGKYSPHPKNSNRAIAVYTEMKKFNNSDVFILLLTRTDNGFIG